MRALRVAASIALACAVTAGPAAGSGPTDYPTFFVEFEFSEGKFAGKIDSSKGKCVNDRKIVLYRKKNKDKKKLGADKTNEKGKFKIGVNDPKDGKYFAMAKSKSAGNDDCQGEKSAKVEID
jgi:hypothetical protein